MLKASEIKSLTIYQSKVKHANEIVDISVMKARSIKHTRYPQSKGGELKSNDGKNATSLSSVRMQSEVARRLSSAN